MHKSNYKAYAATYNLVPHQDKLQHLSSIDSDTKFEVILRKQKSKETGDFLSLNKVVQAMASAQSGER